MEKPTKNLTMEIRGTRPLTFKQRNKGKGTYYKARVASILNDGMSETEILLVLNTGSNMVKNALTKGLTEPFWVQVKLVSENANENRAKITFHLYPMDPPKNGDAADLVLKLSDGRAQLTA